MNDPSSNRRKILQGSLAAPLVLTVSSASAQAVTSFTKCVANGANHQPSESEVIVPYSTSPDRWFRCPIEVHTLGKVENGATTPIEGHWYRVNGMYKSASDGQTLLQKTGLSDNQVQSIGTTEWYRIVYFDPVTGHEMGAGFEKLSDGALAVTISCGGSFALACRP